MKKNLIVGSSIELNIATNKLLGDTSDLDSEMDARVTASVNGGRPTAEQSLLLIY